MSALFAVRLRTTNGRQIRQPRLTPQHTARSSARVQLCVVAFELWSSAVGLGFEANQGAFIVGSSPHEGQVVSSPVVGQPERWFGTRCDLRVIGERAAAVGHARRERLREDMMLHKADDGDGPASGN